MTARNPRRRCRNCPQPGKQEPRLREPKPLTATYEGESDKLWRQTLYACGTTVELLFGYVAMDVPGEPLPVLKRLHDRLGEIIHIREERTREAFHTPQ